MCYTLLSWQERRRVRKEAGMFFAQACGAPIESWNSMEEWPGGIHYKDISKTLQLLKGSTPIVEGTKGLALKLYLLHKGVLFFFFNFDCMFIWGE